MKEFFRKLLYRTVDAISSWAHIDLQDLVNKRLGVLQYKTLEQSGEKLFITAILPELMRCGHTGTTIIDVGSNEGEYTALVLSVIPDVTVHCFEPNAPTADRLERRFEHDSRVKVNRLALGNSPGVLDLFDYDDGQGSGHASIYRTVLAEQHRCECISKLAVAVATLDDYCSENHIHDILLLKVDVEGHELAALCGAEAMIASHRIAAIHFEFNEMNVISRAFLRDFYQRLPGFAFYRLRFDGLIALGPYSPHNEIFQYQNIVAIQENLIAMVKPFVIVSVW